ncbi:hypothetical protein C5167_049803 [Papaver somniferum]|uniref:Uncharacterized protein n=1 Tax=Papaver somniferum TaxID=3469 RepID=A0A4Y7KN98_PAPSO|nr:hypothetical protein C5167_049803 [Papaver somniferum]
MMLWSKFEATTLMRDAGIRSGRGCGWKGRGCYEPVLRTHKMEHKEEESVEDEAPVITIWEAIGWLGCFNSLDFRSFWIPGQCDRGIIYDHILSDFINRIPETALIARSYLPNKVSEILALWRNDLNKELEKKHTGEGVQAAESFVVLEGYK